MWLKPPASRRFSAADSQAPSHAWAPSAPNHGRRRLRAAPRPWPRADLPMLLGFPPSHSWGLSFHVVPPAGTYLNSTWELRLRPIHGGDSTSGVTAQEAGAPGVLVTTATVFDKKPAPHNFRVIKQTHVSAWGWVAAEMFARPHSASSASQTH